MADGNQDFSSEERGIAGVNPEKETRAIDFATGDPPPQAFPIPQLEECAAAILEQQAAVVLQYYPAAGYVPLREWLADRYGLPTECFLVSDASFQIVHFVSRLLTSPGDLALLGKPSYDRAITIVRRAGARVLGVPLESDGFDAGALESLAETE